MNYHKWSDHEKIHYQDYAYSVTLFIFDLATNDLSLNPIIISKINPYNDVFPYK